VSTATQARILVVDDDPELIALLSDALHLLGNYEVSVARDGGEALEQFVAARPDCVVVDIRMPQIDGFQFVRAIRGDAETEDVPIVVLSALVQDRDVLVGMLSGADAYLFKPVKLDDLLGAIRQALAMTAEQRQQRMQQFAEADEVEGG
jgi:CheY-like chemotaxis protein